jgi:hypothetical protein
MLDPFGVEHTFSVALIITFLEIGKAKYCSKTSKNNTFPSYCLSFYSKDFVPSRTDEPLQQSGSIVPYMRLKQSRERLHKFGRRAALRRDCFELLLQIKADSDIQRPPFHLQILALILRIGQIGLSARLSR